MHYSCGQALALVTLRVAIGWHFLYEGITKLLMPNWSSLDYLSLSRWVFAPLFNWIAANPTVLAVVDFLNIWGLIAIGLGLMFGVLTRAAAISGVLLLTLYYVANPPFVGLDYGVPTEGNYLLVNKTLIELFALLVLVILPSHHVLALDSLLARFPRRRRGGASADAGKTAVLEEAQVSISRRDLLKGFAALPIFAAFVYALIQKRAAGLLG